jgi:hypothetical protein
MIDHSARARKAWPFLARKANNGGGPFTYKELCDKLGLHHRAAGFFLGVIQEHCRENYLPPLQALVVNKKTRLPGSGYYGSKRNKANHQKALNKVRDKNWPTKAPKFTT